jgi:hypothetical protein
MSRRAGGAAAAGGGGAEAAAAAVSTGEIPAISLCFLTLSSRMIRVQLHIQRDSLVVAWYGNLPLKKGDDRRLPLDGLWLNIRVHSIENILAAERGSDGASERDAQGDVSLQQAHDVGHMTHTALTRTCTTGDHAHHSR